MMSSAVDSLSYICLTANDGGEKEGGCRTHTHKEESSIGAISELLLVS